MWLLEGRDEEERKAFMERLHAPLNAGPSVLTLLGVA